MIASWMASSISGLSWMENRQQPVRMNEQGAALVSGANPRIFSMVAGDIVSPYTMMMEVLESERYAKIAA